MGEGNDKAAGADKRVHPRVDFFSKVKVIIPDESTAVDVFAGNVSQGGMFLRSNRPLAKGKKVALEFEVDDGRVQVEEGEVVWTKPFEPISIDGAPAGMGIRFTRVADGSRQRIASFIEEELGQAPPGSEPVDEPRPAPSDQQAPGAGAASPTASAPIDVSSLSPDATPKPPEPRPARARLPLSSGPAPAEPHPGGGAGADPGPQAVQQPAPEPTGEESPARPRGEVQGEQLMVSDPPPAKNRALVFGIFVLFVAVVTFVTLYFLHPFDRPDARPAATDPGPGDEPPAATAGEQATTEHEDDTSPPREEPEPAKPPATGDTPAAQDDPQGGAEAPADQPEKPAQPARAATGPGVGLPAFSRTDAGWRISLRASADVRIKHFTLDDPPRLVLDFQETVYTGEGHTLEADPPFVKQVRVGEQPGFTRYVLDFEGTAVPEHELSEHPDGVTVVFVP